MSSLFKWTVNYFKICAKTHFLFNKKNALIKTHSVKILLTMFIDLS